MCFSLLINKEKHTILLGCVLAYEGSFCRHWIEMGAMLLASVLYFPLSFLAFPHVDDEYGHTDASATEHQG
jgi:hypothetical protein